MVKPLFNTRIRFSDDNGFTQAEKDGCCPHKVRVEDARLPPALKAVEKVLQEFFDTALKWDCPREFQYTRMRHLGRAAGVTVEVINGRVKCQWGAK